MDTLYFKSSPEAFEYACKYCDNKIKQNQSIIAIIEEVMPQQGTDSDFTFYVVRIADDETGFLTVSTAFNKENIKLKVGDLVCWIPFEKNEDGDWTGFIGGAVEPEFSIRNGWSKINKFIG